jgi:glycerol transport system permease protein
MIDRTATLVLLLAPALALMLLVGVVPLAFVGYYSLHDTFAGNSFVWVGLHWFGVVLGSVEFWGAMARSAGFAALALAVQVPLGLWIALHMPQKGVVATLCLLAFALPLLAPLLVVGYVWKVMVLPGVGILTVAAAQVGVTLDMNSAVTACAVLLVMDTWHWTGLIVLLCHAGLQTVPQAHYQAARIDGASGWAVFRHIQLPRLRQVLLIGVLLRAMDAFTMYTEAYVVTRGGPDVATTFLSHELVQTALIQFDLGEGAAMSVIYFLIVLAVSWSFFRVLVPREAAR